CDYSLHNVKSRPAKVGDKLTTHHFNTGTRGFACVVARHARALNVLNDRQHIGGKLPRIFLYSRRAALRHPCQLRLEHRIEAPWLDLSLRRLAALDQDQEPKAPSSEAGSRGRLGQRETAITQGKMSFVFDIVVLASLMVAASAAHAACRSPKNICKHFDDCLQRTSDPNNKNAEGIRAGVKSRNGQTVLASAEACARDLGRKQQWDKW